MVKINGKFATIEGEFIKNGFIIHSTVMSACRVNRIFWQPKTTIVYDGKGFAKILEIEE